LTVQGRFRESALGLGVVWSVIKKDLPKLKKKTEKILKEAKK